MSGVDSRIVTMKFDNAQFEQGASTTMGTLDKLKSSLNFSGATKGLGELSGATSGIEGSASRMSAAFVTLSTVAITALANITNSVVNMGKTLAAQVSGINAVKDGFADYELKIGATQTIMAGTGENIGTVTKYLKDLDIYADKTIYSLSDMTSNIGKFTNAGVKLPVAVDAMKGISNVAALSGANAEEASRAMYNLGQAIGAGAVKLQDWKSVELANMGTKEFKEQLIAAAIATGDLKKGVDGAGVTAKGKTVDFKTFNSTLAEGWLTSKALTDTLGNYADETTEIGKRAYAAATEVKTFSMMMETLSAAAGTGWTDTFDILLGNLPEATKLFTGITNVIGGWIGASADSRNKILGDWKELGGRTDLLEGLKNIFTAIGSVLKPIKDAFRDIFPRKTGEQLAEITKNFREFTSHLKIGSETAENLKRIFKGIFSVFSIVWTVVKAVAGAFLDMFSAIGSAMSTGGGNILDFAASLGDMVSGFDAFLKKTDIVGKAFGAVGTVIGTVIGYIGTLASAIGSLFSGDENAFLDNLKTKFEVLAPVIDTIRSAVKDFASIFQGLFGGVSDAMDTGAGGQTTADGIHAINASLLETKTLMERIKEAWQNFVNGFKATGSTVGSGIGAIGSRLGAAWDKIKEMYSNIGLQDILSIINTGFFIALIKSVRDFIKKIGDGFDAVNGFLEELTGTLEAMQKAIKAKAIRDIGLALLAIAVALWILSRIDLPDLAAGLVALVVMLKLMGKTVESFESLAEGMKNSTAGRIVAMSAALILIGLAMIALATALKIISTIPFGQLVQSVVTVGVIMELLVRMAQGLEKSGGAKDLVRASAAIVIMSFGLMALAGALQIWDALDATTILDSIWKVVLVIGGIGLAMKAFPKDAAIIKIATSLLIISAALVIMALALKMMGSLSIVEIAKSLITMGIALTILAVAVHAMNGAKQGAVVMLLVAAAIGVLAVALKILGSVPIMNIVKALGALIAVFVVLGLAAIFLGPLVPIIEALAVALLIMGGAMLAAGAGMLLLSIGLVTLSTLGTAALVALIELLPIVGTQIALAIVAWIKVIGDSAPAIGDAFFKIVQAMIDTAMRILPLLPPLIQAMLDTWLEIMEDSVPKMAKAALDWLMAILKAVRDNTYRTTAVTLEIITKFLEGLAKGLPDFITAGVDVIVAWLKGVGSRENVKKIADAGIDAITGFINGTIDAMEDKENQAQLKEAGSRLGGKIVEGFIWGLTNATPLGMLWKAGGKLVTAIKGGADETADMHSPSRVFYGMGIYIVQGLANGIVESEMLVDDAIIAVTKSAIAKMNEAIEKVGEGVDNIPDPVITPVIDLEQARKDAEKLDAMLKEKNYAKVTTIKAQHAAEDYRAQKQFEEKQKQATQGTTISFEQNNYSPTELSSVDIYRQTKNQLSLAKEALAV